MLRRTFVLGSISAVVLPIALASVAAPSAARAQGASVQGTLEQVNTAQGSIVVRTGDGTRTGRITAQTMVLAGGMPGDVRDLRPGQRVVVQFAMSQRGAARADVVRIEIRG